MRVKDAVRARIEALPPFQCCTPHEISEVAALATQLEVPAGRVLTQEGEPGREFAIILSGSARVERGAKEVAVLGEGDHYGEMALLDGGPRTATITAVTPMTLAVVGVREFSDLLARVPALSRSIMRSLAAQLRAAEYAQI
jgi:CRP-like cAMP-binding protein